MRCHRAAGSKLAAAATAALAGLAHPPGSLAAAHKQCSGPAAVRDRSLQTVAEVREDVSFTVEDVCGNPFQDLDLKSRIEDAILLYYADALATCNTDRDPIAFTLTSWIPDPGCGGGGRSLVDGRRRLGSSGSGSSKSGCRRCRRRREKQKSKSESGCNADLAQAFRGAGFPNVNVAGVDSIVQLDCSVSSPACDSEGGCCGEANCLCLIASDSLCESEGCCIEEASNFDPCFCKNFNSCGENPCNGECDPPSDAPSEPPTSSPSLLPSEPPSDAPSEPPTSSPSLLPSEPPTSSPSLLPSEVPSEPPTKQPGSESSSSR